MRSSGAYKCLSTESTLKNDVLHKEKRNKKRPYTHEFTLLNGEMQDVVYLYKMQDFPILILLLICAAKLKMI